MGETEFTQTYTTPLLARELLETCPEIEAATRINDFKTFITYEREGDKTTYEESGIYTADSSIFDIFTLNILSGDPREALNEKGTLVITESILKKYFGENTLPQEVLGEELIMTLGPGDFPMIIRGVVDDIPEQSHFHFNFLGSNENLPYNLQDSWWNNYFKTYILLHEKADIATVEEKLPGIYRKNMGEDKFDSFIAEGNRWESFIHPLLDIHLKSNISGEFETNGNYLYILIFSIAALFIIIIACVNFINLSTAKAVSRAKEIGIKKTIGAKKSQLITQLLFESNILSFLSVNFALIITKLVLPFFNSFTGKNMEIGYFDNLTNITFIILLSLFIGLLSGIYPAFYISSYSPSEALIANRSSRRNIVFRNILVVFQFTISIVMIIGTFLIDKQLGYIQNYNLGFNKDNVLVIENAWSVDEKINTVKESLQKSTNIDNVSVAYTVPGQGQGNIQFRPEGYEDNILLDLLWGDEDYDTTLELEMTEGRYFDIQIPSDSTGIILNEAAAINLGWEEPLGKEIRFGGAKGRLHTVIGIVKDFHYISMHETIRPMVIMPGYQTYAWDKNVILLRIENQDVQEVVKQAEETWKEFSDLPFEYFFLDESYDAMYKNELHTRSVFRTFSAITIIIAILGLFGLVTYNAEQRTKEIGIRKTMGASVSQVVILLSKDFTKWILVSFIIACPLAYAIISKWLENFAYKTEITLWIFILAGIMALSISWLTVSYQSIKAAIKNPIEALRYE
jgi:putative ABC transport system permease protein